MATANFDGTNYALQATPLVGTIPHSRVGGAVVYCSSDECHSTSTAGAGSTFFVAKLPKGAVVLFSIVYPIDTATFGALDATASAATGLLGVATDTNLFGSVSDLNAATLPELVAPIPDGTTQVNTLTPLKSAADVYMLSAAANIVDTEGINVKMFYTMG